MTSVHKYSCFDFPQKILQLKHKKKKKRNAVFMSAFPISGNQVLIKKP